ncbi:hypothetical protein ELP57_38165, partial [Klebsiella pneumoniae]|nr:hypothetical protein [Klebsiella pneumoniae]
PPRSSLLASSSASDVYKRQIIGRLVPEHDPVHKVTIIPRGRALGVTFFLPEGDAISASRQKLESQISTLYGGRLAEAVSYTHLRAH